MKHEKDVDMISNSEDPYQTVPFDFFQAMSTSTNIITKECFPAEELNSKKRPDTVSLSHLLQPQGLIYEAST